MRWDDDRSTDSAVSRRQWLAQTGGVAAGWLAFAASSSADEPVAASAGLVKAAWPSRELVRTPKEGGRRAPVVTTIAVRPHEPMFASGGDDHHIYLWDGAEGCVLARLEGHRDWVLSLAFSPGGKYLASASNDRRVLFWDMEQRRSVCEFSDARHAISQIAWSHDGRWIAGLGFEDCLRVYDVESRQLARVLKCPDRDMRALAVSPDDRYVAAAGRNGVIRFWRMPEGTHELDVRPHQRRVRALAFSPDGAYLVSAGEDRWLHVHSMGGDEAGIDLPTQATKTLAATFYGPTHLATGGSDDVIRLWDVAEAKPIGALLGHTGSVSALAHTTSTLISGSFDTTIRLWTIVPQVAKKGPAGAPGPVRR